jgi:hypothetical protein
MRHRINLKKERCGAAVYIIIMNKKGFAFALFETGKLWCIVREYLQEMATLLFKVLSQLWLE